MKVLNKHILTIACVCVVAEEGSFPFKQNLSVTTQMNAVAFTLLVKKSLLCCCCSSSSLF